MTTLLVGAARGDAGAWNVLDMMGANDNALGARDAGAWSFLRIMFRLSAFLALAWSILRVLFGIDDLLGVFGAGAWSVIRILFLLVLSM